MLNLSGRGVIGRLELWLSTSVLGLGFNYRGGYMRSVFYIFIILLIFIGFSGVQAYSDSGKFRLEVYTDKGRYSPGDYIKIFGRFKVNSYVGIEVRGEGEKGILVYLGYTYTDDRGYYEKVFRIPDKVPPGRYVVYVASPGYFNKTIIEIGYSEAGSDMSMRGSEGGSASEITVTTSFTVITQTVERGNVSLRVFIVIISLIAAAIIYYVLNRYGLI